jgi:hypothetical protein
MTNLGNGYTLEIVKMGEFLRKQETQENRLMQFQKWRDPTCIIALIALKIDYSSNDLLK